MAALALIGYRWHAAREKKALPIRKAISIAGDLLPRKTRSAGNLHACANWKKIYDLVWRYEAICDGTFSPIKELHDLTREAERIRNSPKEDLFAQYLKERSPHYRTYPVKTGTVYILENERWPNLVKIGATVSGTPEKRAAAYSTRHGYHQFPWQVATAYHGLFDCFGIEQEVHEELRAYWQGDDPGEPNELFEVAYEIAAEALMRVVDRRENDPDGFDRWRRLKVEQIEAKIADGPSSVNRVLRLRPEIAAEMMEDFTVETIKTAVRREVASTLAESL